MIKSLPKCFKIEVWRGACGRLWGRSWASFGSEAPVGRFLVRVRKHCLTTRKLLREVSKRADTPIEPPEEPGGADADDESWL